ncbi:MAG: GNAT family N-acetyltransferase [Armatimonadota bacterium]|nr:MAG: GNAT family N-acetyltransferase [Armatimonadota bacterium]
MENPAAWPTQLTDYLTERLQCEPELLARPGVHLVEARQPRLRVFRYAMPLWIMAFEDTAIASVAPEMASAVGRIIERATVEQLLHAPVVTRLRASAAARGPVDRFGPGLWLYCTEETFTQRTLAEVVPVPPDHPEGKTLRQRHGGEVFGVFRGPELISRSSIKTENDTAWEIAVTTAEAHRRHGLGASVVSRATEFILASGKLALYNCDLDNHASQALAESLGYRLFARDLMWTIEAMWMQWFWTD